MDSISTTFQVGRKEEKNIIPQEKRDKFVKQAIKPFCIIGSLRNK